MVDYKELGMKSGLEIHQQLDSNKLFCNCPSVLRKDAPEFEVQRELHAVAGESGEVDVAVKHEAEMNKKFVYQGYDTTCLVELDEEPPHEINEEALRTALHIALLLNCKIIPVAQIMRKTVIDGSNTSGFQRTVMIARGGFVETSEGRVGIESVFLEEDSARKVIGKKSKIFSSSASTQSVEREEDSARPVSRTKDEVVYKLDRLGIPLVEIATAPDIKTATQAKEIALKIGEILRSCKVKRGLGTIRQDINISIKGSNRVELKGFQDPKIMIKTIDNEINRQLRFVGKGEKNPPEVRNVLPDATSEFQRPMPGSSRMYPETDLPLLKISRQMIDEAKRTLPKLRSELEEEFRKQGLSDEFIKLLFKQNKVEEYKEAYYNLPKANFVGNLILLFPKDLAKKKKMDVLVVSEIIEDHLLEVLELMNKGKIKEEDIKLVLERIVDGEVLENAIKIEKVGASDMEEKIHKLIKEKPGLSPNAYMGLVMKEFKGKANPREVMEIVKRFGSK